MSREDDAAMWELAKLIARSTTRFNKPAADTEFRDVGYRISTGGLAPTDALFALDKISKAVAAHDALVMALEEMIAVYWTGSEDDPDDPPSCIKRARGVLKVST